MNNRIVTYEFKNSNYSLFGLTGNSLIEGAVANNTTRSTVADIEAYIQSLIP